MRRLIHWIHLALCAGLLAACANQPTPTPSAKPVLVEVTGALTYRERIALPDGISVRLMVGTSGDMGEILVEHHVNPPGQVPLPFSMTIPASAITQRSLVLSAHLYDPAGDLLFQGQGPLTWTASGRSLMPQDGTLLMAPAVRTDRQDVASDENPRVRYDCGTVGPVVVQLRGARLRLDLGDEILELPTVPAASGAKFASDDVLFWEKGGEAVIGLPGGQRASCTLLGLDAVDVAEDAPSPDLAGAKVVWDAAKARGVTFRAVGQEPGWLLEMIKDRAIKVSLDYGAREVLAPWVPAERIDGVRKHDYLGDGIDLTILINRDDCTDPMSGEAFDHKVAVLVDGELFTGCGRYLEPE